MLKVSTNNNNHNHQYRNHGYHYFDEYNNSGNYDYDSLYKDVMDQDGKVIVDRLLKKAAEPHTSSDKEIDAFIAKELNKMSMQERQKIFEEIHGVDRIVEETPEFLSEKLDALQEEVLKIHPKIAYEMAVQHDKTFVFKNTFRLTFLRADMFDPIKASKRLVTFFECRLALFGSHLLTKSLTLQDLDKDDMATLKSGYFQILPQRDTAGRAVLVQVQGMFKRSYKLALNMQRMYHYLMCSMVEDMETQRHGYIFVMYQIGKYEYDPPPDLFNGRTNLFMQGSPVRLCGMHMCFDNPIMKSLMRVILAVSGPEARARNRFHEGSHTEVQYKLLSFGIPVDLFPITSEGELKKTNHMKWLSTRRSKESTRMSQHGQHQIYFASSMSDSQIDIPGRNDVLMGKGKPLQDHSGNVALRALVNIYLEDYQAAKKNDKVNYVNKVYDIITKSKHGRFLKKNEKGWWVLADDEKDAREKVGKTFTSELYSIKQGWTKAKSKSESTIQKPKPKVQTINSEYCLNQKRIRKDDFKCFGIPTNFPGISSCCDTSDQSSTETIDDFQPFNINNDFNIMPMMKRRK